MHGHKPHLNEFLHHYFRHKELDEFYLSVLLKTFGGSLIGIFIPIYLLTQGYNLGAIALYFLVHFISVAVLFPIGTKLSGIIGVKKTMAVGTLMQIYSYYLLNNIPFGTHYLYVSFVNALASAIYFAGFHLEFTSAAIKNDEGAELSIIKSISILVAALAPLTGAVIISRLSFSATFITATVFLTLSIFPLLVTKDFKVKNRFSIKEVFQADNKDKAVAYQANGALFVVNSIFWPLFIYFVVNDVLDLGIIVSLSSLLMLFIVLYIGKAADRDKKRTLEAGVVSHSVSWLLRILMLTPLGLFFGNLLSSATSSMIDIPFNKLIYEKARKARKITHYFIYREVHLAIGRAAILLVAIFTGNLIWMFIAAALITFTYLIPVLHEPKKA